MVNVSQLMTVDRAFPVEKARELPTTTMRDADAGMRRSYAGASRISGRLRSGGLRDAFDEAKLL